MRQQCTKHLGHSKCAEHVNFLPHIIWKDISDSLCSKWCTTLTVIYKPNLSLCTTLVNSLFHSTDIHWLVGTRHFDNGSVASTLQVKNGIFSNLKGRPNEEISDPSCAQHKDGVTET